MSTVIQRKVKKPTVLHRAKKIVNSQDKSLHRSMLSHSRIATGYKKKIAALLGNNRALAHSLEMAHVELNNKDKLMVELQRRLTLQSPKRFRGKIQKVCEHLQVIVALLQDVFDDCEDFTDSNMFSFDSQANNSSRPDVNSKCDSPSEALQCVNNSVESNGTNTKLTPFPNLQPQPRFTTAAEMSAILEQSVLLGDENLPPILFPEDNSEAFSNVTRRTKSKSRSTSSQLKSRESKKHSESPQKRKSSGVLNVDGGMNCEQRSNIDTVETPLSPLPLNLFNSDPFPKENSTEKMSRKCVNSKTDYISDSPNKVYSPEKTSSNTKIPVRRKNLSKKKSKKSILIVKLPYTPKRSLELNNKKDASSEDKCSKNPFISKKSPDRRKTFTVEKSEIRRTFVLSPKSQKALNSGHSINSPQLRDEMEDTPSPPQLCKEQDKDENSSHRTSNNNSAGNKKTLDSSIKDDITFTVVQDMDLTCPTLTENAIHQSDDTKSKEVTGTVNDSPTSASKNSNNSPSQLMYGYDPLEGTSKNRKSSISLKKPKEKLSKNKFSSKLPHIKQKHPKAKPSAKPLTTDSTAIHPSDPRTECLNAGTSILQEILVPSSSSEFHISSSKHNSPNKNTDQKIGNKSECVGDGLNSKQSSRTFSDNFVKKLSNHMAMNKPHKEKIALRTETIRGQRIASIDGVQPVVKLNDLWTSVQSKPSFTQCDDYVYIPDSLDGGVVKVETPNKKLSKPDKESINHNLNKDEDIEATLHTGAPEMKEKMSERASDDIQITFESVTRKRRQATQVSYREPPLNKKLRQGDPFTSGLVNVKNKSKNENKRKARSCSMKNTYCEDGTSDSEKSEDC